MFHFVVMILSLLAHGMAGAETSHCVLDPNAGVPPNKKHCYRYVNTEQVLENITVLPSNGGINSQFGAYNIQAELMLGANSCHAQGLRSSLREEIRGGQKYVVGRVQGWQRVDLVCIEVYQPVRSRVDLTVRGPQKELEGIIIKNAEELGLDAPLTSRCLAASSCIMDFSPSVCFFDGREFYASNLCLAKTAARKNACLKGVELDTVRCEASAHIE